MWRLFLLWSVLISTVWAEEVNWQEVWNQAENQGQPTELKVSTRGNIRLTLAAKPGAWAELLQHLLLPEFRQQTGIEVSLSLLAPERLYSKQKQSLLGPPYPVDLLTLDAGWVKEWAANGWLLPLESNTQPSHLRLFGVDDKTYAYGFQSFTLSHFYRQDLFEHPAEKAAFEARYGTALELPHTTRDFSRLAEFFRRDAGEELAGERLESDFYGWSSISGVPEMRFAEMSSLLWSQQQDWLKVESAGVTVLSNVSQVAGVIKEYRNWLDFAVPQKATRYRDINRDFIQGKAAMMPFAASAFWYQSTRNMAQPTMRVGYMSSPGGIAVIGGTAMAVSYATPHPDEARMLADFLTGFRAQFSYALVGGMPMSVDVLRSPYFQKPDFKGRFAIFLQVEKELRNWNTKDNISFYASSAMYRMTPLIGDIVPRLRMRQSNIELLLLGLRQKLVQTQLQHGYHPVIWNKP